MSNPFGALFKERPGVLAGMKGTRPATPISEDFQARVNAVDPALKDYNYAGEAYDAVIIAALAAQVAGTTDPKVIAQHINAVTIGHQPCQGLTACLAEAKAGKDVAYRGITVRSGFTESGEPSTTSYGTVHFGATNQLDSGKTEYLRAGSEASAARIPPQPSDPDRKSGGAPLVIGALMTAPSETSVTSQARFAGARLAIKEINAAGGVLGMPVRWVEGSDGADAKVAIAQLAQHKAAGVHVLIGTSGSGVATAIIPEIVKHGMVMISPSNTAASLSTIDDGGLYFRTAPSDVLQARALADMIMRDGARKVTLIGRKDAYGTGLIEGVRKELASAGMAETNIMLLTYEIEGSKVRDLNQVARIAGQTIDFRPDGVLVVGLSESAEVIKVLADANLVIRH